VPLHALAERQGLLVEHFDDGRSDRAVEQGYDASVPWRFADARIEAIFRAANRVADAMPELLDADVLEMVTRFVLRWPVFADAPGLAALPVLHALYSWSASPADAVAIVGATVAGFDAVKEYRKVRRALGYMPESFTVYQELTVEEFLLYTAAAYAIPPGERQRRVDAVIGLVDLDPAALDRFDIVDEVPAERQGEVLDLANTDLLREGVDGLFLGIGWQHPGLVPDEVGSAEVAAQRGRDVQVADLVPVGVAVDPDHPVLRLAVLVRSEHDAHGSAPAVGRVGEWCEQ
jgi:hypothetical protein